MYISLPTNTSIPVDEAIQISADHLLNLYVLKTVMVQMILSLILPTILIRMVVVIIIIAILVIIAMEGEVLV